jgi:hypothetical protein
MKGERELEKERDGSILPSLLPSYITMRYVCYGMQGERRRDGRRREKMSVTEG